MSDQNLNGDTRPLGMIVLDLILRSVLAVNFLHFLSFIPSYQLWPNPAKLDLGGGDTAGVANFLLAARPGFSAAGAMLFRARLG